ncbi:MAG: NAD(P)/FAD-dependent oxidoreductase [Chitinophagaceae bacterium]|nr:NAD(P)/FAD-dependent oxidoreductase [Chitinophagaceae bacterium]
MKNNPKAIIIGAGPAGLTAAYELLTKTNIIPIIIESDSQVGGLSKTIDYKGNKIDIGGHRFFSKSTEVIDWWLQFLPLENTTGQPVEITYQNKTTVLSPAGNASGNDNVMMIRPRKSRIYYQNKFFDYPLQLNGKTIRNLGFSKMIRIGFSYFLSKIPSQKKEKSLEDFFINRFGKELYETFFKDYTEKVWGVPCSQLPATWGRQRIKDLSVTKVLKHAIGSFFSTDKTLQQKKTSTSLIEQFLYPKYGPGQMWEAVANEIEKRGGQILLNKSVGSLNLNEQLQVQSVVVRDSATGVEGTLDGDYFFSTMPVKALVQGIKNIIVPEDVMQAAGSLEYRDFLIVGILASKLAIAEKEGNFTDNWIYIQDAGIKAGRVQFFHNWSSYMVKNPADAWIGVEYFCNETDDFWKMDDSTISKKAIAEMVKIGLINEADIKDTFVAKVKKAYPSYFGGYSNFNIVRNFLDGINNLFLVGRNGMHKYNNSDHSMLTAMAAVKNLQQGKKDKTNLWDINTEDVYHEEEK